MGGWSDRNLQVSMSPVYIPHEGEGGRGVGDILSLNISNSDISKYSLISTNIHVVWTNFLRPRLYAMLAFLSAVGLNF